MNQLAQRGRPIFRQPLRLLDTLRHGAFLRRPSCRTAGWWWDFPPEECAISLFPHHSGHHQNERRNRLMIGQTESTRSSDRVLARVAGLLALLAVLGCFAPTAPALTPTPSGQFVSDTGSGEEAAQRSRFNDGQRGLQLALRAQDASDRGAYEEAELLYQQALPLFERALGPEDLRLVGPLANLADVYRALGKFDRAEVLYARLAFLMQEAFGRSEEHTSELQSRLHLVCRLL